MLLANEEQCVLMAPGLFEFDLYCKARLVIEVAVPRRALQQFDAFCGQCALGSP